jgi:hypothetical protein
MWTGGKHHAQALRPEHHRGLRHAAQIGQQIRVTAPRQPGRGKRLFVDGRRDDGGDTAGPSIFDGRNDRVVGGAAGPRVDDTGREWLEILVAVRPVQHRLADVDHARIARGLQCNLRPDAGRIRRP